MISVERHRLSEILRRNGYSLTKGRMMVFNALFQQPPMLMSELHDLMESKIDRVTLYRIVKVFEELGVLNRISLGWKYKLELSDLFSHHHHHLTCLKCGTVIPLPDDPLLERRLAMLGNGYGFCEVVHQLELQGVCSQCQLKLRDKSGAMLQP